MNKKLFLCFAAIALAFFACSSDSDVSEEIIFECSGTDATAIPVADFTFDNIQCWAGEGENRAMFIVQWNDEKEPAALAWGYKWDGTKYGVDMIMDIAKADKRLWTLLLEGTQYGTAIGGIGYDISGKNSIQLSNDGGSPQTPANGIIKAQGYDFDDWTCTDNAAHWKAGWYVGYWSYWVTDNIGNQWKYSNLGASSIKLANNGINAWYFDNDMNDEEKSTFYRCMGAGEDACDGRNYFSDITPATNPILR